MSRNFLPNTAGYRLSHITRVAAGCLVSAAVAADIGQPIGAELTSGRD